MNDHSQAIKIIDEGITATPHGEVCRAYVIDAIAKALIEQRNAVLEEVAKAECRECRSGHIPTWDDLLKHFYHIHPEYEMGCSASIVRALKHGD